MTATVPRYMSFVVRVWQQHDGAPRVDVEHIQTGERMRADSLAAATAWMETVASAPAPPPEAAAPASASGR